MAPSRPLVAYHMSPDAARIVTETGPADLGPVAGTGEVMVELSREDLVRLLALVDAEKAAEDAEWAAVEAAWFGECPDQDRG